MRAIPLFVVALVLCGCTAPVPPAAGPASPAGSAAVPSSPAASPPVPAFQQSLPGSARRECVAVPGDATLVRSGDFIAGDFVEYRRQWHPELGPDLGKLFWLPARPQLNAALTVTATSGGRTETYSAGSLTTNDAGQAMYPSGIPLPAAGTWKLVAQAGDGWGCFELALL
ncbi:hypothetical protein ACWD8I_21110 [Micromonospora arida]